MPSRLYFTVVPSSVTVSPFTLSGEVKLTVHTLLLRSRFTSAEISSQVSLPLSVILPLRSGTSALSAALQEAHIRQAESTTGIISLLFMICHPFRKIGQHTAFRLFRKIHAEYTDTAQVTPTAKFRSCFCRVPHTVRTVRKDMRPAARHSLFQYPVPAVRLSFRQAYLRFRLLPKPHYRSY